MVTDDPVPTKSPSATSASAILDALIHGRGESVSFRHLSTQLCIPSREAQSHLLSYISTQPSHTLCILWCVTHQPTPTIRRQTLTTHPARIQNALAKTVWALAPAALQHTQAPHAAWFAADAARDRAAVADALTRANPLRDGRYNAIRSATAVWKPAHSASRVPANTASSVPKGKTNANTLLAQVKAKVKARDAKRVAASGNRAQPFKSASNASTLFTTKKLGADAAARIKAADSKQKHRRKEHDRKAPSSSTKKSRRVIRDDDDDDDDDDDGESEAERERLALEKEAAEREAAEAEREELRREVEELTRQHEDDDEDDEEQQQQEEEEEKDQTDGKGDQPESPQLKELGEESDSPNRSPAKRKLNEAFGLPSTNGPRRIRREVEETVEKDGYLVTKRVIKVFDDNGNEVVDEEPSKAEPEKPKSPAKNQLGTPLKPHNSQNGKNAKAKFGSQKKDAKRPTSKLGANGGAKKNPKKKIKGNIMSYFGKKS